MNITDLLNPYAYAMRLRRLLYRRGILKSESVSVPVISVGNLSMGGTGKTPFTLFIAKYCIEILEKKTAIVLRGYKRKSTGYLLVSNGNTILQDIDRSGDEAQLYAQELLEAIVICDEARIRGARNAAALGAEVILLDDGFQHMRLKRDLNILLINSDEGIPAVLPFGKGRESASAMVDADLIIETNNRKNKDSFEVYKKPYLLTRTIIGHIRLYMNDEITETSPEIFEGKKILALSGIAHPERFKRTLAPFAASVISVPLGDHTEYNSTVLKKIIAKAKTEKCDLLATTTKDAVKMLVMYMTMQQQDHSLPPLVVVHTGVEFIGGEEILLSRINDLLKTH